jgi:Flp pilus assembly protein CpaB
MDIPAARRIERPRWVNGRVLLGLTLFLAAFGGVQRVLAAADDTVQAWSAAGDLATGTQLTAEDLVPVDVHLSGPTMGSYVRFSEDLTGTTLIRPVTGGELIPTGALVPAGTETSLRTMTIPVTPEHAVGGEVAPGQKVDVIATFDSGDVRARSVTLLQGAEVADIVTGGGLTLSEDAVLGITVQVSPKDATRLAFAIRTAEIDIALTTGTDKESLGRSVSGADFDE